MPKMPPKSLSLQVEPQQPPFQRSQGFDITSANLIDRNNESCDINNSTDNCGDELNVNGFSFDGLVATNDRQSWDEDAKKSITIGDNISDYEDCDIELMQEALAMLVDDEEEKERVINRYGNTHHSKYTAMKNHYSRKMFSDRIPSPVRSIQDNHCHSGVGRENHLITPCQDNNIDNERATSKPMIDLHPRLMPQVTFDEEEDLYRQNFFHRELPVQQYSKIDPDIPTLSPRSHNEPSQWLIDDLASNDLSIPQSLNSAPASKKNKKIIRESLRANKETKHKHWSEGEDETLKLAVEPVQNGPIDWIKIARNFFNNTRSATQCKNRWRNVSK